MKRGRAEAIVEGVLASAARWPEFAEKALVPVAWREQIQRNLRLSFPNA
jgi:hypothetical protein